MLIDEPLQGCIGICPRPKVMEPAVDFLGPLTVLVREEGEVVIRFVRLGAWLSTC